MNSLLSYLPSSGFLLVQDGADSTAQEGPNILFVLPVIVAIFWFVLIAPERKKQKKRDAMLAGMSKGNRVMTTSGLYGTIVQIKDDVVTLQVADSVRLRFSRAAIQTLLDEEEKSEEKSEKS